MADYSGDFAPFAAQLDAVAESSFCLSHRGIYDFPCEEDFLLRRRFFVALLLALIASGCSLYRRYEASRPETIRQTESMLSDAGFHTIQIDTSDQAGLAANLPPYELRSYPASSGSVFWYYDPKICSCVPNPRNRKSRL